MQSDLRRYADIVSSIIKSADTQTLATIDPACIHVEQGLNWPEVELPMNSAMAIKDAAGHSRAVYRPLLIYSCLLNDKAKQYRSVLAPWIATIGEGAWPSLVRSLAGITFDESVWIKQADVAMKNLIDHQQPDGLFLKADSNANPETRWYDELLLLHAISSYAIRRPDARFDNAIKKCACFHLVETQPDHASAQPWALLAFMRFAPSLADQVLHALSMQYPGGVSGVPLMLLNDVMYGLRQLL